MELANRNYELVLLPLVLCFCRLIDTNSNSVNLYFLCRLFFMDNSLYSLYVCKYWRTYEAAWDVPVKTHFILRATVNLEGAIKESIVKSTCWVSYCQQVQYTVTLVVICSHALCPVDLLLHICDTWFDAKGFKVAETLKYLQCNAKVIQ